MNCLRSVLLAVLLMGPASLAFADLPCQEESVSMDYYARRMYGDGYSDAEYTEFETQTTAWEQRFVACMNDYKAANGEQAESELSSQLIDVTREINNARRGS